MVVLGYDYEFMETVLCFVTVYLQISYCMTLIPPAYYRMSSSCQFQGVDGTVSGWMWLPSEAGVFSGLWFGYSFLVADGTNPYQATVSMLYSDALRITSELVFWVKVLGFRCVAF